MKAVSVSVRMSIKFIDAKSLVDQGSVWAPAASRKHKLQRIHRSSRTSVDHRSTSDWSDHRIPPRHSEAPPPDRKKNASIISRCIR